MTETRRRRSAPATKAAILEAARARFSAEGFERVRLRDVAADVGVDAAMVVRYFGTKDNLFAEAAELRLDLPDLTGVPPEELAATLLPRFFEVWEDNAFLSLLRASATSDTARAKMQALFVTQVLPVLTAAAVDQPERRAALLGTQILGLAFSRYVLGIGPVSAMSRAEVMAWLGPVVRHYLTGDPDGL
ncbi:AcrR family transcriptional regulator [Crossiella equi]|uniref:AcrR family transcriptional regulator n=1 Tax=Crossiella equi TaxID=130796 RepID=A0ABS5A7D2_9PSEU|nr:TetR family transcriptional regulator [Crossiella equi]MBP2472134.1 AcrR family transcriptional regulator [Crossiella equi]